MFKLFDQFNGLVKYSPTLMGLVVALLLWLPSQARAGGPVSSLDQAALKAALVGGGVVTFTVDGTITLTNTLNVNYDNTTIDGSGHNIVITGNGAVRVFAVPVGINFTNIHITIAGGNAIGTNGNAGATGANSSNDGASGGNGGSGGSGQGGAIRNSGNFTAINCVFLTNNATGGTGGNGGGGGNGDVQGGNGGNGGNGGVAQGGAIYNSGTLLLTNCSFSANVATGGNGGLGGTNGSGGFASYHGGGGAGSPSSGAAIYNLGNASVFSCTFANNSGRGGNSETAGTRLSNTFYGLSGAPGADSLGGGICNLSTLSLLNCTFFENQVTGGTGGNGGLGDEQGGNGGNGGNAFGGNIYNSGTINVTNATIAGGGAIGGTNGIAAGGTFPGSDGVPGLGHGDNIADNGGAFNFKNSILTSPAFNLSAFGPIADKGNNLSSDGTPAFTVASSRNHLDPNLDVLDNYGGPTLTMQLLAGSPAIDTADPGSEISPLVDQRGVSRPLGAGYDIGAFEFGAITFSIRGQILVGTKGISGVTVTATSSNSAGGISAVTDFAGNFVIQNLLSKAYSVVPQPSAFFTPTNIAVSIGTQSVSGVNFTAKTAGTATLVPATNQNVQFSFSGIPNQTYRIQVSTNLSSPANWQTIFTNLSSGTSGAFNFTDATTNSPVRFYRAVTP
jgi:hypothetical protein